MTGTTLNFAANSDEMSRLMGLYGDDSINTLPGGTYTQGSGTGGIVTVTGPGTVQLFGTNTYAGGTHLNGGIAEINTVASLGIPGMLITVGGTATLKTDAPMTLMNSVSLGANAFTINTDGNSVTWSGGISDSGSGGSLSKDGGGTLTLQVAPTYIGGTTIIDGTLQGIIGLSNVLLSSDSLDIEASGTFNLNGSNNTVNNLSGDTGAIITLGSNNLTVNQSSTLDYNGAITGAGAVTKDSAGTLGLFGINNYSGGTTVSAGVLSGNTNGLQGDILNNAQVTFTQNFDGTYAGNLSGTGAVTVSPAVGNTIIFSGINTYAGPTTVTGGTLQGNTTSLQGNFLNSGTLDFDLSADGVYAGVVSGAGTFQKDGAGTTLTLSQQQTYTGNTSIVGGTLQGSVANVIMSSAAVNLKNNGVFDLNGFDNTLNNLTGDTGAEILLGSNELTVNQSVSGAFNGIISGDGSLIKSGLATLTLGSVNTYTGSTMITSGTLRAGIADTIASSTSVNVASAGAFDLNGFDNTLNNLTGDAGAQILLGSNTLTINESSAGAFNGIISGGGLLVKSGSGALTLSGINTNTGLSTVAQGQLILNGQVGGDLTVNSEGLYREQVPW